MPSKHFTKVRQIMRIAVIASRLVYAAASNLYIAGSTSTALICLGLGYLVQMTFTLETELPQTNYKNKLESICLTSLTVLALALTGLWGITQPEVVLVYEHLVEGQFFGWKPVVAILIFTAISIYEGLQQLDLLDDQKIAAEYGKTQA